MTASSPEPQPPARRAARSDRPRFPRGAAPAPDGLLLVDKAAGLTSHDVVGAVRVLAATRKVGHAGTLDPMATGLLVLGVGKGTRFLTYLVGADKTYTATVRLGQKTSTEDAEGEITTARGCPPPPDWPAPGLEASLQMALAALTGAIMQVPSAVSAIKVDGVRSYQRVRQGQEVTLPARPVTVHELRLLGPLCPTTAADGTTVVDLELRVSCSSGTYVRALARDLGQALGTGAHLTALRRTQVGPFDLSEARSLEQLGREVEAQLAMAAAGGQAQPLRTLPLAQVAQRCFSSLELTGAQARALGYGQPLPASVLEQVSWLPQAVAAKALSGRTVQAGQSSQAEPTGQAAQADQVVAGFAPGGSLVALLARRGGSLRPLLVLEPAVGGATPGSPEAKQKS
ncbi:tRNA pseudouridine(55) synthase TruB [Actinomyces trachealis]|uniref:tRNA pseudouridine(55) synthase TruB n=1 Tax=Actinomyces trachealis TaxID=2763540 RepID=UPI00189293B4|nr:tRNA pseudouridine(55) synthase TruB [Actinomyces trachealis]